MNPIELQHALTCMLSQNQRAEKIHFTAADGKLPPINSDQFIQMAARFFKQLK